MAPATLSLAQAREVAEKLGYPLIIRASFTVGGAGSGMAYNREEMETLANKGLDVSLDHLSLTIDY